MTLLALGLEAMLRPFTMVRFLSGGMAPPLIRRRVRPRTLVRFQARNDMRRNRLAGVTLDVAQLLAVLR